MTRRRFSERQTIASLIWQGVPVTCFRTKQPITLENVGRLEREHLVELGLVPKEDIAQYDTPEYCRYSLKEAHALITNGNGATSAGSSKHRVAKARRMEKARLAETSGQDQKPKRCLSGRKFAAGSRSWPERKIPSRPFPKREAVK